MLRLHTASNRLSVALAGALLIAVAGSPASAALVQTTSLATATAQCKAKTSYVQGYELMTLTGTNPRSEQLLVYKDMTKPNPPGDTLNAKFNKFTCASDATALFHSLYPSLPALNYEKYIPMQEVTKAASALAALKECNIKSDGLPAKRTGKNGEVFGAVVGFGGRPLGGVEYLVYIPALDPQLATFAAQSHDTPPVLFGCLGELTWATRAPMMAFADYMTKLPKPPSPIAKAPTPVPCNFVGTGTMNLDIKLTDGTDCKFDTNQITAFSDTNSALHFTTKAGSKDITVGTIMGVTLNGTSLSAQQLTAALSALSGKTVGGGSSLPAWLYASPSQPACTSPPGKPANFTVWVSLASPSLKYYMTKGSQGYGLGPGGYACISVAVANGFKSP